MYARCVFLTKYYLLDFQIVIGVPDEVNVLCIYDQKSVFGMLFEKGEIALGDALKIIESYGLLVFASTPLDVLQKPLWREMQIDV